jgi:cytoskeleton protein RodZ
MSVGTDIAAARKNAKLSVEQVSERTRIRAGVIKEIEQDDFTHCGGDVYARGHLRSIATVVGIDAEPLISEFDRAHGTAIPSAATVFEAETITAPRRGPNWSAVMALVLVVAIGLVAIQIFRGRDEPARQSTTVESPLPTLSTSSSSSQPSQTQTQVAQAPQDVTVKLQALANGVSWVQVSDHNDSVLFSGNISDGQVKTFNDPKRLHVVIGNAAGVAVTVNGTNLGSPGASGEVARLTFTPNDPEGNAG